MRFLIHIPQLIYGGAEKVLVDFSNFLIENGHEVEILETYEKGLIKNQFNKKVKFNSICSKVFCDKYYITFENIKCEKNFFKKFIKLTKKIAVKVLGYERIGKKISSSFYKNKSYDLAINYLEIESPKFIIKNIKANKYLQWIHIDISKLDDINFIDKQIKWYRKLDKIICVSKDSKYSFDSRYKFLKNKTEVIYNFYNFNNIIKLSEGNNLFNKNDFNILSVGRLVKQKGYERAIEVFAELKKENYEFKWYIIGDGILKDKLLNKIKLLGLEDNIKLLGIKENPYPYIKQCDLFFLPSLYEGFPTVTIEAKILKKPVLATDVSGIKEQIINNKTGLIVENSYKGIYNSLKKILSDKSIIKLWEDNFNINEIIDNLDKYNQLFNIIN